MISPEALKMARSALGWDQRELAHRAGLSPETVKRAEGDPNANLSKSTMDALASALAAAGVMMEMSFKRGLTVRLTKTAEARKRVVEVLAKDADEPEKLRRARAVIAEYRQKAQAFYEGEPEARERVRSWLEDLKEALRGEAAYLEARGQLIAEHVYQVADDGF